MIFQGSDKPITIVFDTVPTNVSVSLVNEITVFKHWNTSDMTVSSDGKTYTCPITQQESMSWEEGPAAVKVKWNSAIDDTQDVQFYTKRDWIIPWPDNTILAPAIPEENDGD